MGMSVPAIPDGRVAMTELLKLSTRAMSEPDFRAERYRKHREAWVLGHSAVIYNDMPGCLRRLEFAEAGDSASIPADFAVYDAHGTLVTDAEIAELTDVWDWGNPGTEIPEVENSWRHRGERVAHEEEIDRHRGIGDGRGENRPLLLEEQRTHIP